jgi:TonB-linked SusC/RagA family outer membrane protein
MQEFATSKATAWGGALNQQLTCLTKSRQAVRIMKITAVLLLGACLQLSARGISQTITLSLKDVPLQKVFKEIERQTDFTFFVESDLFSKAKKVTVSARNLPLTQVLDLCFKDQPFTYSFSGKIIVVSMRKKLVESDVKVPVQEGVIDIKGRVINENGEPVEGVTVNVKGSSLSVTTNSNGEFLMRGVDNNATLVFTSVNMETFQLNVNGRTFLDVALQTRITAMQEVVINKGYYTEKRKLATGNVSTVKSIDIERQPITNPLLALQGRVAGLVITQANGLPGGSIKVEIRGRNTISQGRDPLYIINGVPFVSQTTGGLATGILGSSINPLNMISPTDIESIEILKDADATAIYGSRAANGVVLITTKKGKAGPVKINVNFQTGFGEITRKANLLNTQQYLEMRRESFKNDNITPTMNNAKDLISWDSTSYTDWQKVMIGGTSKYIDARTSISGGSEYFQYTCGSSYHRESTVFPGDWNDQKVSVHFNMNSTSINQKFRLEFSGTYLSDNNSLPQIDFTKYITIAPNAPSLYKSDGTLDWQNFSLNPFRAKTYVYNGKTNNLVSNAIISYKLMKGLIFKTSIGYSNLQISEKTAAPISYFNPATNVTTGSASFNNYLIKSWIIEPQINYVLDLGRGHFNALVGASAQKRETEGQVINGSGYTNDALLSSLAAAATVSKGSSIYEQYRYSSVFARVGYDWKEKYVLNLTGRRDGSSRFGPGKQFGNFGSLGFAWIFSKERFIKSFSHLMNYGKLRFSYGTSGNEPANSYAYLELYNFRTDNPYGGSGGIYPNNLPVPKFSWELNKKFEAGLELGFFQDRINMTAIYYQNRSFNQLVSQPLSNISGFSSVVANLPAIVQNTSLEFTLTSNNIKNKNFDWTSSLNVTVPKNKLVAFPNIDNNITYSQFYTVGQSISSAKVYRFAGVNPTTGIYEFYDTQGNLTFTPIFLTDNNKHVNVTPKIYGGFLNSFSYRAFQVNIDIQFVQQTGLNYLFRNSPPGYATGGEATWNQPVELLSRWEKVGDVRPYQKFTTQFPSSWNFITASDAAYSDASFIRLKNVSVSYDLSHSIIKKLKIIKSKIYFQAQNIFTLTKYKGADPETQSITILPPLKVLVCGIQITL